MGDYEPWPFPDNMPSLDDLMNQGEQQMMNARGITMNVTCNTGQLLSTLQSNLENHKKLVAEARAGYFKHAIAEVDKAQSKLADVRASLEKGEQIAIHVALAALAAPADFSSVYRTAISMLQRHTGDTITLTATEFRQLVEDEWDWIHQFTMSNSAYSSGTVGWAKSKGIDV